MRALLCWVREGRGAEGEPAGGRAARWGGEEGPL